MGRGETWRTRDAGKKKVSILTHVAPERAKAFESCSMPRSATNAEGEYVIVMMIRCT